MGKLFFDGRKGGYWKAISDTRFLLLNTEQIKMHLRHDGLFDGKVPDGLSPVESALYVAQTENHVDYAGPLAGHPSGLLQLPDGSRVLVTSEPTGVFSKPEGSDECPKLERFFGQLFGPEQLQFVLAWLKVARSSLYNQDFRPGQLLALAGPSACGKSLFQALVTVFLGGRAAKPYRYMTGGSAFNSDLAQAEHLMIEDESASTDIRTRRAFGVSIKDFTVNTWLSVHAKGRDAINLPTFKRLTLSVNEEPENLSILPPLDSSLMDKISLLKCRQADLPEDRKETWNGLANELPRLARMLWSWRIPPRLRDVRFGVRSWQNPDLVQQLNELAPEFRLLNLIEQCLTDWPFVGTAEALEQQLRTAKQHAFSWAVDRLLQYPSACGTYLARLETKLPARVSSTKSKGKTNWKIHERKDEN